MIHVAVGDGRRHTEASVGSFEYVEHRHTAPQRRTVTSQKQRRTLCIHLPHGKGEELQPVTRK